MIRISLSKIAEQSFPDLSTPMAKKKEKKKKKKKTINFIPYPPKHTLKQPRLTVSTKGASKFLTFL
jgi:hypothetical protein